MFKIHVWDTGFAFRFWIQVLDLGLGLKFGTMLGIQVWDSC